MEVYTEVEQKFGGRWKIYKSENFEAFLQEVGVNALLRKVATKVSPETELTMSGGKIKIAMKTGLFTSVDEFSLGEEYMKEIQGTWMKAKGEYEEGKLIIVQTPIDPKNKMKSQTVHREIVDDELVMTLFVGDVVCKRFFKKMT
ncbi:cellular retinoic acid-binding protein 1-like [Mytilus edulis]|uniref:cellular retinoic acid-binding protein 1-like n=1 Tax=Mytilus edulis TaxID=6550 RepID=UPI0039F0025B